MNYQFTSESDFDREVVAHISSFGSVLPAKHLRLIYRVGKIAQNVLLMLGLLWISTVLAKVFAEAQNERAMTFIFFFVLFAVYALCGVWFLRMADRTVQPLEASPMNGSPITMTLSADAVERVAPGGTVRLTWQAIHRIEIVNNALVFHAGFLGLWLQKSAVPADQWDEVVAFARDMVASK